VLWLRGRGGEGVLLINERLLQVLLYKRRLESDRDVHLSAADIEKSIDYRKLGKPWKEQMSERECRV